MVFDEIVSHPVKMIQISHDLRRELIRFERAYFANLHGAVIVTEAVGRVQCSVFNKPTFRALEKFPLRALETLASGPAAVLC